jgi:hypothetical protein
MSTVVAVATEENGSGSEGLEGWRSALAKQVGLPGQVFSSLRDGEVVKKLFEGCISPGLRVGPDGTTVDIPDDYSIKVLLHSALSRTGESHAHHFYFCML